MKVILLKSFSYRIGLKVLDFPDMTLYTVKPTGLHAMAVRHLTHLDYTLIQVIFYLHYVPILYAVTIGVSHAVLSLG